MADRLLQLYHRYHWYEYFQLKIEFSGIKQIRLQNGTAAGLRDQSLLTTKKRFIDNDNAQ